MTATANTEPPPLKILFVINNIYTRGNGLAASARQTIVGLRQAGMDVRILSAGDTDDWKDADIGMPHYHLPHLHIPLFQRLIESQGYGFARAQLSTIKQAVEWADIIHCEEPFFLQVLTVYIARKLHKPCVSTYHIHPENLTATMFLDGFTPLNRLILWWWKTAILRHCSWVQCPSENVYQRLKKSGVRVPLQIISNGLIIEPDQELPDPLPHEKPPFTVLCIGRFSREKDQKTILRAMKYSRFASDIQLIFAGRGPTDTSLRRQAQRLVRSGVLRRIPQFRFMNRAEMDHVISTSDLYVHAAFIEVEGMSCLEALRHGITPLLAEAPLTASSQFAHDHTSRFPARNAKALAARIDYWLSRPKLRASTAVSYRDIPRDYDFSHCITLLIDAYRSIPLPHDQKH